MARARSPNSIKAEEMYLQSDGKLELVEIAKKINVSDGTVRSWKNRYKWNEKLKGDNATLQKDKQNIKCNVANKKVKKKAKKEEPKLEEVEEIMNSELTDKQRLFSIYYIKYFNATKAAIKAEYSKGTAGVIGYQLLRKTLIEEEIQRLKKNKLNRAMLSEDDIFQKYIDIAFSDITDYVEFGQEEVPIMGTFGTIKDEDGNEVKQVINVIKFKQAEEVDGTIISEVSQGKNGAKLKLQDKMKALQWLSDRMDLLPIETQIKLENEEKKLNHMLNKDNKDNSKKDDVLTKMLEGLKHGI